MIHMVTAAQGAEKFYTTENNKARTETIEQAREIDAKIIQAWLGHPRHRIVTNTATFEHKVSRVIEELCDLIGAPLPGSIEHRYLLKVAPIEHDLPTFAASLFSLIVRPFFTRNASGRFKCST